MTPPRPEQAPPAVPVAVAEGVTLRYGRVRALDQVAMEVPGGCMAGLIGPDGVGKSSLLALFSGARIIQDGRVTVLGGDMADAGHRRAVCPRIAYMPQGLGRNLYPTLSVFENIDFFARLFGQDKQERHGRIARLLRATGLSPFAERPAGQLSGGMKQKLGLCCALVHDPDLLILDEPTTGVDPLSRRQFWDLVDHIRADRPGMSVLVATAYMEEASRFDWLAAMNGGGVLATGAPADLLARTDSTTLEAAFIAMLPEDQRQTHRPVTIPPRAADSDGEAAIRATDLTMRFGDFTAVDGVGFTIPRGEIFGFLGSNGCGKTTTMKMLTGLLQPTEGQAWLFGHEIEAGDLTTRRRVGYMSQSFSLYSELTVRQNLDLHARLFHLPADAIPERVDEMARRFGLHDALEVLPDALPLGHRQRLSLAVAMIHKPEMLILDEPTSGVDPVARDTFWRELVDLSRRDGVTIFISTHFMNEAERCDRISLMHAGRVLVTDTPRAIRDTRNAASLEEAFIAYLEDAAAEDREGPEPIPEAVVSAAPDADAPEHAPEHAPKHAPDHADGPATSLRRLFSYSQRETLELLRDPIRLTLALLGSVILMIVVGYGVNMDVEDLSFAILDRDQTSLSRDYALDISGSRYFVERSPLTDEADLDRRMRAGEISLAIEIPPGFARNLARGRPVEIAAWIDGAMPQRAETIRGYVQGLHTTWLQRKAREQGQADALTTAATIETRFRYNPDVRSLPAMVPAVIPLLLMLIPAMLAALSVVREKELGSIINFYVTPTRRLEFLIGKQLPYILLAMLSFLLLTAFAVFVFDVPLKGSLPALATGALLYVTAATALGLLISIFMRSQIAAIFGTAVLTLLPAVSFSGMINPVSSLQGIGRIVGTLYPTTHFLIISRGTFSKALGFGDFHGAFLPLVLAIPVLLALGVIFLKKQER